MNLRKIGVIIRRQRLLRRDASDRNAFRLDGFLCTSPGHPFFDIQPGYPVCSRATLLKLENGKEIREEELYRFFLDKLDLSYAYSPNCEQRYKTCFGLFDAIVTDGSLTELNTFVLPMPTNDNLLYAFYDRLLLALRDYYTSATFPSIERMSEFCELWFCVPRVLRPITEIFILSAYDAHPFNDHIDLRPILRKFPSHPLEMLASGFVAVTQERYLLSVRLTDRFDKSTCTGELPVFLLGLIQRYIACVLGQKAHPTKIVIDAKDHPLKILSLHTFIFRLGMHALQQNRFDQARFYFTGLEDCGEPFGIYAALIANRPYRGNVLTNPKLMCLSDYLNIKNNLDDTGRLAFLMTMIFPLMGERERFIVIFLRVEVLALVQRTQRYKSAYLYLHRFDPSRNA